MTREDETEADLTTLPDTLFVLWGFPELSETFIHREMRLMHELGGRVNVLAARPVPRSDLDPALAEIVQRTLWLGTPLLWPLKASLFALFHPLRYTSTLLWAVTRPHRTLVHRLRAVAMVLAAASVAGRVKRSGVRYVHAHFAAYHTELAMDIARLLDIPYGVTGHATGIWKDRNILEEKVARAQVVLTCTRHNVEHLKSLAPDHAHKIHLVHHGLDLEALPDPAPLPGTGKTRWLAVGRLVPKKGFDVLLEAAAELLGRQVDFSLTIVGTGPEQERLEGLIRELQLQDRVRLAGAMPNARVLEHMQSSHALVAPSVRDREGNIDGIPNVILEAMALSRPVVGSDLSGIPEVVIPDETGLLVPPGSVTDLADAMQRMGQDREEASRMGARGREMVHQRFDVRRNVAVQLAHLVRAARPEPAA